jgi:hypothetical protein
MTDITSTHLEAAIIDQNVAGAFYDKRYAFVAVYNEGWQLGVAIANESGYNPIGGKTFKDRAEANEWADGLNAHIGLTDLAALHIIGSTMGGNRVEIIQRLISE